MPAPAAPTKPLLLICGDDEFTVKQRAREIHQQWTTEIGGMDHETIDAAAGKADEALRVLSRLREALQTLPFFGGGKVVWLRNCNFLGDERTAESRDVTETLAELAQELKDFSWGSVRLLISAGKVDKRKVFYKTVDKLGTVETYAGLSMDDKFWEGKAEVAARETLRSFKKEISAEALGELVTNIGPNLRLLQNEAEKLALYVGDRRDIEVADVTAICSRNKTARAFALGDALGNRDLPKLLATLDEEFWAMNFDKEKSEIGLLYGLISKVRTMLLLKEMMREGWIKPETDYNRFKAQMEKLPATQMPEDKKYNPALINPYMLFLALPQSRRYTSEELIQAMDLLLKCNHRLVSSGSDERLILQQTLVQIASPRKEAAGKKT